LFQRPLNPPFVCTDFFDEEEQRRIAQRLRGRDGLWLVIETLPDRQARHAMPRLIGMVDVEQEAWRQAGVVWNIAVDRAYRGRGWGRKLMQRVIEWARRQDLRAIVLETQTNNWPACLFYRHMGFQLSGFDDHFYTNQDLMNKEMALFWTYEL
jgi:ribosomal protein S18 acetylase RimI-like enzyme